jgi:hypothetical protein
MSTQNITPYYLAQLTKPEPSVYSWELAEMRSQRNELLETLKGVAWKIQVYGSHWSPSRAEREAIAQTIANVEGRQ